MNTGSQTRRRFLAGLATTLGLGIVGGIGTSIGTRVSGQDRSIDEAAKSSEEDAFPSHEAQRALKEPAPQTIDGVVREPDAISMMAELNNVADILNRGFDIKDYKKYGRNLESVDTDAHNKFLATGNEVYTAIGVAAKTLLGDLNMRAAGIDKGNQFEYLEMSEVFYRLGQVAKFGLDRSSLAPVRSLYTESRPVKTLAIPTRRELEEKQVKAVMGLFDIETNPSRKEARRKQGVRIYLDLLGQVHDPAKKGEYMDGLKAFRYTSPIPNEAPKRYIPAPITRAV